MVYSLVQTTNTNKKIDEKAIYRLNEGVFLNVQDGVACLADLERGQFYGLDSIGSMMLSLVLDCGQEAAISQVAQEYEVAEELIREDLIRFLNDLEDKHLLLSSKNKNQRCYRSVLPFLRVVLQLVIYIETVFDRLLHYQQPEYKKFPALLKPHTVSLLLIASWFSLQICGWTGTIRLWQSWHGNNSNTFDTNTIQETVQAVDRLVREVAAKNLLLPMNCKQRAIAGYQILRSVFGLPAILVVGIERYPFRAHAWVECNGLVVTDDRTHCELFTPIARYS